jgi:hypothetical protein
MKLASLFLLAVLSFNVFAKKKVIYKYKKYERFDFDALDVKGENSSPGDLSIGPRFKKKFRNKIPERKDFNREMIKAIDSIL